MSFNNEDSSPGVVIFLLSLLVFTAVIGLCSAIAALWRIFWTNADELKNVDKVTIDSTVSCIIFHSLTVILDIIGFYLSVADLDIIAFLMVWDIVWSLSKMNLYFIYIYRVYITFKDTDYAYSRTKIYILLSYTLLLQLYNMAVFMIHSLKQTGDQTIIYLSSIYLILDAIIVLLIVFLFINPIINLMYDLRTKSEQLIEISATNHAETHNLKQTPDQW